MLTGPDAISQIPGGKVLPIYLEGRLIPVTNQVGRELGLSINEVVRSIVEIRGDSLAIMVNGRQVDLPAQLRFSPGEALWLRFIVFPNGHYAFKTVLGPGQNKLPSTPVSNRPVTHLPGQAVNSGTSFSGLSPVVTSLFAQPANLAGLLQILSNAGGMSSLASLASGLGQGALAQFLQARPSMGHLSPELVKAALRASGLLSEAKLAKGFPANPDLKFALRELLSSSALGRLRSSNLSSQSLEASIREIESSQADALAAQTNRDLAFSFILPFRDADPVLISLFRPKKSIDSSNQTPLTLNLYTNSDSLGEVWMKTIISEMRTIDLAMWATREVVASRAAKAKPELAEELESAGLQMKGFLVFNGRRPPEPPPSLGEASGVVIDQKA